MAAIGAFITANAAAIGATSAVAGTTLTAASVIGAGQAGQEQAKSQAAIAQYNSVIEAQRAAQEEAATTYQQRMQAREAARRQGSMRAALGASGARMDEGTPLLIQARQAMEDEADNMILGASGQARAQDRRTKSALDSYQAGIYRTRGRNALSTGLSQAGGSLLSGLGSAAYDYYRRK